MADTKSMKYDVGIAGLDGMGPGIAQNISSHDFQVAACDLRPRKRGELAERLPAGHLVHTRTLVELAGLLRLPRTIFIFGETDAVIDQLLPHLAPSDLLIDAGDSYFKDAGRRARMLSERSIEFMCLGLGGGDAAAGRGAMIMAGGRREVYERARSLLESLAANVKGRPSVGYLGSAEAACFARMVHDGIEYALMQLVSETFDLMQRILALSDEQLHDVPVAWHIGVLKGYLAEVSGHLVDPIDEGTERRQIRQKLDSAKNDPAARWITRTARELGVPIPIIDAALGAQDVLPRERQRSFMLTPHRHPSGRFSNEADSVLDELTGALYAAMIIAYAEGFDLLAAGSDQHGFHLDAAEIARIWKGGCSLRAALLDDIASALRGTPALGNLLCDEDLSEKVMAHQESLRHAVWRANESDIVVPGLLACLDSLDSSRDAWLPVNLVQFRREEVPSTTNPEWETEEKTVMG